MKLYQKTMLVLGATILLSVAVNFFIVQYWVLADFERLERAEAEEDLARVEDAIQNEINHLSRFVRDWAAWDDSVDFIVTRSEDYVESNLIYETFEENGLNLIHFYDVDGDLVWGKAFDLANKEGIMIAEFPIDGPPLVNNFIEMPSAKASRSGLLSSSVGPLFVAARPIVDSAGNGPVYGTLVMGKILTDEVVEGIAKQVHAHVRAWQLDDPDLPAHEKEVLPNLSRGQPVLEALDNNLLEGHALLDGLDGQPTLLITARMDRRITMTGRDASYSLLLSLFAGGVLVLIAAWLMLQFSILRPISRLTKQVLEVARTGDLTPRNTHKRRDEIGILGAEFDGMLKKLSEARGQSEKVSYRSGMADVAATVTHDIRNALVPIILRTDRVTETLKDQDDPNLAIAVQQLSKPGIDGERHEKLTRYLTLRTEESRGEISAALTDLEFVANGLNRIEEILGSQDAISRSPKRSDKVVLADALDEALNALPADRKGKASITLDQSLETARPVAAPKIDLVAVLTSLLANAEESIVRSGRSDGEIAVRSHEEEVEGHPMLHLSISNNGQPLSDEATDHLFQSDDLQNLSSPDRRSLHWSANCVNQLNGKVFAHNDQEKDGTILHLILPLAA
ncbi:MAG: CHASE4 domain-containing protein [Pseudomonadota bacterium]